MHLQWILGGVQRILMGFNCVCVDFNAFSMEVGWISDATRKEFRLISEGISIDFGWVSIRFWMGFNVFCLPFNLLLGSTWFSRGLSYAFYWVPLCFLMVSLNSSIWVLLCFLFGSPCLLVGPLHFSPIHSSSGFPYVF